MCNAQCVSQRKVMYIHTTLFTLNLLVYKWPTGNDLIFWGKNQLVVVGHIGLIGLIGLMGLMGLMGLSGKGGHAAWDRIGLY